MNKGKTLSELKVGDSASLTKKMTEAEVKLYATLSGDTNPVHLDEAYAQTTIFKTRVVHGMFVSSLFSALLGNHLPGNGTIYLGQELRFTKPVFLNDTVTATVTISELVAEKNRAVLETVAVNQHGDVVVKGSATVLLPV